MPKHDHAQYYVCLMNMDDVHARSGILYHQCLVLVKANPKQKQFELVDAYSFYSHEAVKNSKVNKRCCSLTYLVGATVGFFESSIKYALKHSVGFEPKLSITPQFRFQGAYGEIRREEISDMLAQGAKMTPLVPISSEPLATTQKRQSYFEVSESSKLQTLSPLVHLDAMIGSLMQYQRSYFKTADLRWLAAVTGKSVEEIDAYTKKSFEAKPKTHHELGRKAEQALYEFQENLYKDYVIAFAKPEFKKLDIINWKQVSHRRIQCRELFHLKNPDYELGDFSHSFSREARICKTTCLKLLLSSYPVGSREHHYFNSLLKHKVRRNYPRLTQGLSEKIFVQMADLSKPLYQQSGKLIMPSSSWQTRTILIDLKFCRSEKRMLHTLKHFLMTMTADWYQKSSINHLSVEIIQNAVRVIDICFNTQSDSDFIQKYQESISILKPALRQVMYAITVYQHQDKLKLPQNITAEFGLLHELYTRELGPEKATEFSYLSEKDSVFKLTDLIPSM